MRKPEHDRSSSRTAGEGKSGILLRVSANAFANRLRHLYFLARRPMTLGVRAAAFDPAGRVFLVRHTYLPGWYLPGGGVERGETAVESVVRELGEEGNLELAEPPRLVSIHLGRQRPRRDHILFYVCRNVRQTAPKRSDREIAASGFFAPDALPADATPGTLRRLEELRSEMPADPDW
ncbi:NUDIX domain-containing protein [Aureimonas leprariae]|nr:NUDIX domain-containing protein [Aureimonas leprariae]